MIFSISEESETCPKSNSSNTSLVPFPDFIISCSATFAEFLVIVFELIASINSDKCLDVIFEFCCFSFVSMKPITSVVIRFAISFALESEYAFSNKFE